ncbi:hypothetical protein [Spiroplasma endosymbiont of Cantharis rufa]|uniref:hypothetical protein n=1 Tax=Spiroplasma endosymbiont of Cantharis rufa TaxID=3066279 RepID=UPI0030D45539
MNNDLLRVLEETIYSINKPSHKNNKRSAKKVDNLHYAVQRHLSLKLEDSKYKIWTKTVDKKEYKVNGFFFKKNSDIVILNKEKDKVIATIEFKMPLSSVQKNTINSITNMIGESTNIQLNGIKTFWIYCIREVTPVFNKNGVIQSFYKFDTSKYINLYEKKHNSGVALPYGLSLNIYKDNLELEKFREERDIGINLDRIHQEKSLFVEYVEDIKYNRNGLFINDYLNFIDFIVEEVKRNE